MQRNFRLIYNALLFIFIFIDIIILTFLTLDFAFNLKATVVMVRFDVFASILILIHTSLRLSVQENKYEYITKNWFDIFAIVPLAYIVILLFPNTYLIVIALLLLRIYALYKYMLKIRSIIGFTRKTKLDYATFILLLTLIFGSLIFFWAESPVNPQASTLDNSVFFMIVTMSTVGYGNIVPYTGIGKIIAVIGIIVGLGYTGWVTAAIASSLVDEFRKKSKKEITEQRESMSIILNKLDKIEKELEEIKNMNDSE